MHYFTEQTGDNSKYPYGICNKAVGKDHRFFRCNLCKENVYNDIQKNSEKTFICVKCKEEKICIFRPSMNHMMNDSYPILSYPILSYPILSYP